MKRGSRHEPIRIQWNAMSGFCFTWFNDAKTHFGRLWGDQQLTLAPILSNHKSFDSSGTTICCQGIFEIPKKEVEDLALYNSAKGIHFFYGNLRLAQPPPQYQTSPENNWPWLRDYFEDYFLLEKGATRKFPMGWFCHGLNNEVTALARLQPPQQLQLQQRTKLRGIDFNFARLWWGITGRVFCLEDYGDIEVCWLRIRKKTDSSPVHIQLLPSQQNFIPQRWCRTEGGHRLTGNSLYTQLLMSIPFLKRVSENQSVWSL